MDIRTFKVSSTNKNTKLQNTFWDVKLFLSLECCYDTTKVNLFVMKMQTYIATFIVSAYLNIVP